MVNQKFKSWVDEIGGSRSLARLIRTESPTVRQWLNQTATPRPLMMMKLVKLGRGRFDYADIINETTRGRKKK